MKLHIVLTLAALTAATTATAQAVPHPGACRADAAKLCPAEVAAMDRDAAQACLAKKLSLVSPDCRENIQAMQPKTAPAKAPPATSK